MDDVRQSPRGLSKDVVLHAQNDLCPAYAGGLYSELVMSKLSKRYFMSPKKPKNQEELLSHNLIIRVTEFTFKRLEKLHQDSNYSSIAEVARMILSNKQIKLYYTDASMNGPMEEMALIRKELKAIGININQITRSFNQDIEGAHRSFYVLKVADLYNDFDKKVERLLIIISKLAEKWLQKS